MSEWLRKRWTSWLGGWAGRRKEATYEGVGMAVGELVGAAEGACVVVVGREEGDWEGRPVGSELGVVVGRLLGVVVGRRLGAGVVASE